MILAGEIRRNTQRAAGYEAFDGRHHRIYVFNIRIPYKGEERRDAGNSLPGIVIRAASLDARPRRSASLARGRAVGGEARRTWPPRHGSRGLIMPDQAAGLGSGPIRGGRDRPDSPTVSLPSASTVRLPDATILRVSRPGVAGQRRPVSRCGGQLTDRLELPLLWNPSVARIM